MHSADLITTTWFDRLAVNIFSYLLVLLPIAFIVVTTKYKLCPTFLQSSLFVQWFVFGRDTRRYHASTSIDNNNKNSDQQELLSAAERLDDRSEKNHSSNLIQNHVNNKSKQPLNVIQFLCCFLGLQVSYLIWGVLQEKIMTTNYETLPVSTRTTTFALHNNSNDLTLGSQNKRAITFHDSQFLVFINRTVAFVIAIIALIINDRPKKPSYQSTLPTATIHKQSKEIPSAPLYEYVYCSLSNILSAWCQYEALKYVNFPTQVLSKACKIVPVMLMSQLILRKKHQTFDYICALGFSIGMTIFLIFQPQVKKHNVDQGSKEEINLNDASRIVSQTVGGSSLLSGLLILALYLAFDSFTSNWQQSLFSRYKLSECQMMAAVNFYSILLTITSLTHLDHLTPALKLLASSPQLLTDCMLMSLTSAFGQLFVYYTIKNFGSVIFTMIMISRQLISILLSYIIFRHEPTFGSFIGLLCVFGVACVQIWHRSKRVQQNKN